MSYATRVWLKPEKGEHYAIGGDPAEGLARGDDSVLQVLKVSTGEQACEIQGKIEPVEFGEVANALGRWYNTALIGIENNKDLTSINVLARGCEYPNLYRTAPDRGKGFDEHNKKIGWNTNHQSRNRILNNGRACLKNGTVRIYSTQLLGQWETFALEAGKYQAISGAHDDLIMAWLIAVEMREHVLSSLNVKQYGLDTLWNGDAMEPKPWDNAEEEGSWIEKQIAHLKGKEEQEQPTLTSWGNLV